MFLVGFSMEYEKGTGQTYVFDSPETAEKVLTMYIEEHDCTVRDGLLFDVGDGTVDRVYRNTFFGFDYGAELTRVGKVIGWENPAAHDRLEDLAHNVLEE